MESCLRLLDFYAHGKIMNGGCNMTWIKTTSTRSRRVTSRLMRCGCVLDAKTSVNEMGASWRTWPRMRRDSCINYTPNTKKQNTLTNTQALTSTSRLRNMTRSQMINKRLHPWRSTCAGMCSMMKMDPPIHTEYLRSGGATTLILIVEGTRALSSLVMRSPIAANLKETSNTRLFMIITISKSSSSNTSPHKLAVYDRGQG
jgi:hypothetical protein